MIKGRFAPSPTGRMHMGNVYAALLSWLSAKSKGGKWLLRIEDIDPQRSKQEYADQLMRDLEWLGLTWDEGPFYQSQRSEIYNHHLNILKEKGLIYPSYKTRAERLAVSAPQKEAPSNSPRGETVSKAEHSSCTPCTSCTSCTPKNSCTPCTPSYSCFPKKYADALRVPDLSISYLDGHYGLQTANMKTDIGDFIVRRRDGAWAYQLCVVVDDALMGVTEVVRGCDLLQSACQQIYLYDIFGYKAPEFIHLPLLTNENGQRLSKRDKSLDLGIIRQHLSPEQLIGNLAYHAGIIPSPTPSTPSSLIPLFSWDKVPTKDVIVRS